MFHKKVKNITAYLTFALVFMVSLSLTGKHIHKPHINSVHLSYFHNSQCSFHTKNCNIATPLEFFENLPTNYLSKFEKKEFVSQKSFIKINHSTKRLFVAEVYPVSKNHFVEPKKSRAPPSTFLFNN